jgi:Kef-type K+ transport system membrane component KefB
MARVSTRIGWGKSSAGGVALAVFNLLLAAGLYSADHAAVALVVVGFAILSASFAFVHPHRVLETDEDDDPRLKVGDLIDD